MKRFKVGDLAIWRVPRMEYSAQYAGSVVEIYGFFDDSADGLSCDYGIIADDGERFGVFDWQLAPIEPPTEPISLTRREEVEA